MKNNCQAGYTTTLSPTFLLKSLRQFSDKFFQVAQFWIQIRTAQTYLTQKANKFFIRTPNWVIFLLESRFRALSNPIGITLKFVRSIEISTKQSDTALESESNNKSKGVAPPPRGPMSLVQPRVCFRLPWDVLPPPWPPPLAPI